MLLIPRHAKTFTESEAIKFKHKGDEKYESSPLKKIENVKFLLVEKPNFTTLASSLVWFFAHITNPFECSFLLYNLFISLFEESMALILIILEYKFVVYID